jgi:hypothetical protein
VRDVESTDTAAGAASEVDVTSSVVARRVSPARVAAAVAALVLGGSAAVAWTSGDAGSGGEVPAQAAAGAAAVVDGAAAFRAKGCATCHNGPDSTAQFGVGPNLAGLASRAGERREGLSAREYVVESILAPDAYTVPGYATSGEMSGMPMLNVSSAEVDALVSYLLDG